MIRRILVGLNGAPAAESMLPYVVTLAGRLGAELTLLYAVDQREAAAVPSYRSTLPQAPESGEAAGRAYLEGIAQKVRNAGVAVESRMVIGDPVNALAASATPLGTDIIALATHGRSGFHHLGRRCVAEEVLDTTATPVLLLPVEDGAPAVPLVEQIVASLDGSQAAATVLPLAAKLARTLGVPLVLFQAVAKSPLNEVALSGAEQHHGAVLTAQRQGIDAYLEQVARELRDDEQIVEAQRRRAVSELEAVADMLRRTKLDVRTLTPAGEHGPALNEYTWLHPQSLVVMAAPASADVAGYVDGHPAHHEVEYLGAPVLVVRPEAIPGIMAA